MAFSVQMPALGESVTEGTVTRWLKQEGDTVELDEPLVEVSTDKVDTEIPAPAAGVLTKIVAQEDDTVEVGGELAVIGDASECGGPRPRAEPPSAEPEAQAANPPRQPEPEPEPASASPNRSPRRRRQQASGGGTDDPGADARARRVGDRGHRDPLAQEGRRFGSGRRRRWWKCPPTRWTPRSRHRWPACWSASPPTRTPPSPVGGELARIGAAFRRRRPHRAARTQARTQA